MTIVSATPTPPPAPGALAFGIGTSEVEHVPATQTLVQSQSRRRCGSTTTAGWARA